MKSPFSQPAFPGHLVRGFMGAAAILALSLFSGCGDPPEACFDVSETLVDQNEDVVFTNCSQFQQQGYLWDFGDGTSSTNTNPTHKFTTQGEFLVTLTTKGKTSATDDVISQIIKVGERKLRDFRINAYPAQNPLGDDWDTGSAPDIAMLFIKDGFTEYQSPTNTDLSLAVPYTMDVSAENFFLTPDTWLFAMVDVDSAGLDTMAKVTVNLATMVPNEAQTIQSTHVSADFLLNYLLQ